MIRYAGSTRTQRNLCAMQAHGWRMLFNAAHLDLYRPGWRYALDNGAWSASKAGHPIDLGLFAEAVDRLGAGADFVVAPDIVAGGLDSLRLSEAWIPRLLPRVRRVLIAVQDGMTPADVAPLLSPQVGISIGGTDAWKEAALARGEWARLARERDAWCHALRVNTRRRLALCSGCTSFDGTNPTRFGSNTARITRYARQLLMEIP